MGKNNILHTIIKKFPDHKLEIENLFAKCEEFREICEDYVICWNSIKRIESTDARKDEYLFEFKNTLVELEEELLSNLKSHKNGAKEK